MNPVPKEQPDKAQPAPMPEEQRWTRDAMPAPVR